MERPTTILIGGGICAALIIAAGYVNSYRLETDLHNLEARCEEEGEKNIAYPRLKLLCNANDLVELEGESSSSVGIQAQIVSAQKKLQSSTGWPYVLAAVVLIISFVPWAWYFFLRRIRELRDAVSGK